MAIIKIMSFQDKIDAIRASYAAAAAAATAAAATAAAAAATAAAKMKQELKEAYEEERLKLVEQLNILDAQVANRSDSYGAEISITGIILSKIKFLMDGEQSGIYTLNQQRDNILQEIENVDKIINEL